LFKESLSGDPGRYYNELANVVNLAFEFVLELGLV